MIGKAKHNRYVIEHLRNEALDFLESKCRQGWTDENLRIAYANYSDVYPDMKTLKKRFVTRMMKKGVSLYHNADGSLDNRKVK